VSGPSPFAAGWSPAARFDDKTITGHELEPMIAVNPANPAEHRGRLEAGCRHGEPDAASDLVASSRDGGKDVDARRTIPGLTVCTGGVGRRRPPTRGWRAGPRRHCLLQAGFAASLSTDPPTTAVVASHSRDGGRSWAVPATVAAPLGGQ